MKQQGDSIKSICLKKRMDIITKETSGSMTIYSRSGKLIGSYMDNRDFHFLPLLGKVKSDAKKICSDVPVAGNFYDNLARGDAHLLKNVFDVSKPSYVYELDINRAYWQLAKRKFLSNATYKYGAEHKEARLAALGALATKYTEREYVAGELVHERIYRRKYGRLFYEIRNECISYMEWAEREYQNYVVGYWVDALFIKCRPGEEYVIEELSAKFERLFGLTLSVELYRAHYSEFGRARVLELENLQTGRRKPFNFGYARHFENCRERYAAHESASRTIFTVR